MQNVTVLSHPLLQAKLTTLRNADTSAGGFRAVTRQLAELMAYEVARDLATEPVVVNTPGGEAPGIRIAESPLVVSVLRAGILMQEAFLDVLPGATAGHLGIYRDTFVNSTVEYYNRLPEDVADRTTFLLDPMLGSGATARAAVSRLWDAGVRNLTVACFVAAQAGIEATAAAHPGVRFVTLAVDPTCDDEGRILPGLGDAGARIYGVT